MVAEAHTGADLVAHPQPFLLIGVDPVAALRGYVLESEDRLKDGVERVTALLAQVRTVAFANRMGVAAVTTLLHPARGDVVGADRKDHLVDDELRPLVVDDRPWAELRDCQKAGAREVFVTIA